MPCLLRAWNIFRATTCNACFQLIAAFLGAEPNLTEHAVDCLGDQFGPAAEVLVERGRTGIQALREGSHRQGVGAFLVDYQQRCRDDPVERDGGRPGERLADGARPAI